MRKIFWVWNLENNNNKFFADLTKREIAKFQNHALNTWGWSSNRIRRVKSTLSSLSNYIQNILDDEEEFENYKPIIRKIENPAKEVVREKTVLSDEQVDKLLNTLVEQKEYEAACGFAIAAFSGMRHAELLQMKVEYFNDEHFVFNSMWKTDKVRAKGFGRGGKQINKFVLYGAKPYIDLWMKERKARGINSEWLFVTYEGDQIGYPEGDGTFTGGEVLAATMTGTYGVLGDPTYDELAFENILEAADKNFASEFK